MELITVCIAAAADADAAAATAAESAACEAVSPTLGDCGFSCDVVVRTSEGTGIT
jgi:hypothetical protein